MDQKQNGKKNITLHFNSKATSPGKVAESICRGEKRKERASTHNCIFAHCPFVLAVEFCVDDILILLAAMQV